MPLVRNTAVLSLLSFACAFAQATGTILGTVKDASDASVAGAHITVVNQSTGATRTTDTNTGGGFILPRLPVGSYTVRAEQSGFKTYESRGVLLQADQSVTLPIALEIGDLASRVTVEASATLLQTNTSTLSQVVEQKRIEDLPLNGRNVLQLIRLNAGIVSRGIGTYSQFQIAGGSYGSSNSVNGTRGNQTAFLLDGGNNTNGIINSANPFPNPDAVQEFSIQTNNFSAEFGNVGGGIVNVVTKSGTNNYHGSVYEFYRDGRLNARSFFATTQDALKRHQFGATIGGPVFLPRLYNGRNKTFFFFAYQGTRTDEALSSVRATALTAEQKSGNLSSISTPVRDPLTNLPFPGNIIPQNRFDPVTAKFLELLPAVNTPGTTFLTYAAPSDKRPDGQYTARLDHQLTGKDQITARWFQLGLNRTAADIPGNLYYLRGGEQGLAKNAHMSHTHIFSPQLLNVAKFTYNFARTDTTSPIDLAPADFGSRMIRINPSHFGITISGYSGISTPLVGRAFNKSYEFADTFSYSNGRHNLRAGYQYLRDLKFASNNFNGSGAFTFTGQRSGHAISDFLLGLPISLGIRNVAVSDSYANYHGLFLHDDWRVSQTLTLNLGLRWDGTEPYIDRRGYQPYFRPGVKSVVFPRAPLGYLLPGDPGVPESDENRLNARPADPDRNNFAPRFGFAWNPTPRVVVRGAYGIFFSHATAQITAVAPEPWVRSTAIDSPPTFSNPFGTGQPVNPNINEAASDFVFSAAPGLAVMDPNFQTGIIQAMNFGVERQLTTDMMVRAMYVGTIGQHLEVGRELNAAPYTASATIANINARRPYTGIANIRSTESTGRSWYHSMQLSATRRFARGVSFQVNYTLSKSIDDTSILISPANTSGPDPNNRRLNRGLSDYDATHTLVASGIWELPPATRTGPAVLRHIVNGWQLNPIVTLQSGVPFTPSDSRDLALSGVGNGVRLMPNGDLALSTSRPRGEQIARYFNTTAFSLPPTGTYGVTGRNILRGPGEANVDFSVFKSFPIRETIRLQFRSEFFNLFNRPGFGNPVSTFNSPNFGQIVSSGPGRVLQFGLRLTY